MESRTGLISRIAASQPAKLRTTALMVVLVLAIGLFAPTLASAWVVDDDPWSTELRRSELRSEPLFATGTDNQVSWTRPDSVDGYEVQVATDDRFRPNQIVASVKIPSKTDRYTFGGLSEGVTYYYRVRSIKASRKGPWSVPCRSIQERPRDINVAPKSRPGHDYVTEVGAPITLDGSLSFDVDGLVTKYEWDVDGNGTFDTVSALPTTVWVYAQPGLYQARLRVTDDKGLTDIHWTWVRVLTDTTPPVASFIAPAEAYVGDLVGLDASASYDPNGTIASYSWDFESDGAYDEVLTTPLAGHTWTAPGEWVVMLDVRDAFANVGSTTRVINVTTISDVAPALPQNVVAADSLGDNGGSISLTWDANTEEDLRGYRIYRALSGEGPFEPIGDATAPTFTDAAATLGVTYYYAVTAYDVAGNESEYSVLASAASADDLAPAMPAGFTAVDLVGDEDGAVVAAWIANTDDAVGYTLYVMDTVAGTSSQTDLYLADSSVITGLVDGREYSLSITARDAAGNVSDAAPAALVTPLDDVAPAAPASITAADVPADEGGFIAIEWSASTAADAAGYKLYRDGVEIADTTELAFTDAVADTVAHSYTVAAYDEVPNLGAESAAATAAALDNEAPAAPASITAADVPADEGGFIAIEWSASTAADVAGYKLYRDGVEIADTTELAFTDAVADTAAHRYTVAAYDEVPNLGAESDAATAAALDNEAPAAPASITAADVPADEGGFIAIEWSASTAADVAGYIVYRDGIAVRTTDAATLTITDMVADTALHTYTVAAFDEVPNTSAPSTASGIAAAIDNEMPLAPASITAADVPDDEGGFIAIAWTASTSVDVAGYKLYRDGVEILDTAALSFTDAVSETDSHSYTVAAYDEVPNLGAESAAATAAALDNLAPEAPTGVTAADVPDDQGNAIKITWTAPAAADVAGYTVYREGLVIGTTTSLSFIDPAAYNRLAYTYTVAAFDEVPNTSAQSAVADATAYDNLAPAAPTGLVASDVPDDNGGVIELTWNLNTEPDVRHYNVSCNGVFVGEAYELPYTITDVGSAANSYSVTAVDVNGNESPASDPAVAAAIDNLVPATPVGVSATDAPADQGDAITVSWTANTEADLAGYTVAVYDADDVLVTSVELADASTTISGLTTGAGYTVTVIARDASGNVSAASAPVTATALDNLAPPAVTGLTASLDHVLCDIDLDWDDNTAADLAGYKVYRADGTGGYVYVGEATESAYVDSEPTVRQLYRYKVLAFDTSGLEGAFSDEVAVDAVDTVAPSAPTDLVVTNANGDSIGLAWTASVDDCPGPVSYRIERRVYAGTWELAGESTEVAFTDAGLPAGKTYEYRVKAVDDSANASAWSNVLAAAVGFSSTVKYEDTDPAIAYIGSWTQSTSTMLSGGSQEYGWAPATYADLTFYGSKITWFGAKFSNRGISNVYIDGVLDTTVDQYAPAVQWQVPLYTKTFAAVGEHTIRIEYTGTHHPAATLALIDIDRFDVEIPDTVPPSAPGGVAAVFVRPSQVAVSWAASTDPKGVSGYHVERRSVGGEWEPLAIVTTLKYNDDTAFAGTAYEYRVRAADTSGNASAWSAVPATTPAYWRYEDTDPAIAYIGSWTQSTSTMLSGGSQEYGWAPATYADLTFYGSKITWFGAKFSNRGISNVYIDGVLDTTVDQYAPAVQWQVPLYTKTFATAGEHTIRIEYTGTSHPAATLALIDIDRFDVVP